MRIYPKTLKQEAAQKVDSLLCNPRRILLFYAAVAFGVSLLAALMNLFLNGQAAQTAGLDGMKVKSIWETTATVSELAVAFLSPIWSLGLVSVALGFARGKEATKKDLASGFSQFGRGLGLHLLRVLLYVIASFVCVYIGTFLISMLSDSARLTVTLEPFAQSIEENPDLLQDTDFLRTLPWLDILACTWVPLALTALILVFVLAYLTYRLRLASYFLVDGIGMGPMQALRKSFSTMKGNVWAFVRLDLSYWWFYLLIALLGGGGLAALIPFLLGMPPVSDLAAIGIQFFTAIGICALYWWKGAEVETTYALAYESIKINTL